MGCISKPQVHKNILKQEQLFWRWEHIHIEANFMSLSDVYNKLYLAGEDVAEG